MNIMRNPALRLKPYTTITLTSLNNGSDLLDYILSAASELQPRKVDKPIVLYGAGELGKLAKGFFDYLKKPFLYVVDKNSSNYVADQYWYGTRIVSPEDVNTADKKNALLVLCIVTLPLISLRDSLIAAGWEDIAFFYDIAEFYCSRHPISNGWFINTLSEIQKDSIKKVYSSLSDDFSRMHYLQFIAWRKLRVELLFSDFEININDRFFIPEVVNVLNGHEVFVDCGAHKGFVTKRFIATVKGIYKDIYMIEPDKELYEQCESTFKNIKSITIIGNALSEKNGEGTFSQGFGYASKLSNSGKAIVKIQALDSLNIPATFIKIHIEGGELSALTGAVHTIQKYRPIIVVTTYHNIDGVWRIPYFLFDNAKNYVFLMRLHSWAGTGAVFYAIPRERSEWGTYGKGP